MNNNFTLGQTNSRHSCANMFHHKKATLRSNWGKNCILNCWQTLFTSFAKGQPKWWNKVWKDLVLYLLHKVFTPPPTPTPQSAGKALKDCRKRGICEIIISPLKRVGPFIWINLNPLHPRMHCAKFGWNWLSGSGKEDFKISSMYFRNYRPLGKGGGASFEQNWIPFTQRCIVSSLVEIGPVVLEKKIFSNFVTSKINYLNW